MGQDRITPEERAAIEQAIAEGQVQRVEPRVPSNLRPRRPLPVTGREPAGRTPAPRSVPAEMPVKAALEWAFQTEKASFDFDELGASAGGQRKGISMEQLIFERHMLGKVAIDTSPGRSEPAEDAEIIASIVRSVLPWSAACLVADLARAGREPDWMRDAAPRILPIEWVYGRGGARGRTADAARLGAGGWPHQKRRNRKGAIVEDEVLFTPVTVSPTAVQIAAARRMYLEWRGCLLAVRGALQRASLRWFSVTDELPPMMPWKRLD
ncbi:hypothetical protein [Salipiger sp. PrR003]|uniref:hypothetical protein n=1 Tax=Salipiger sp. PrR003 TaxID=2706776 RepID=UPI0013DD8391|nr:hypothetical protein [Salipiger sp. PrR003]NDV52124.1 hypothetical protein [Salipiger sp. PrR003]